MQQNALALIFAPLLEILTAAVLAVLVVVLARRRLAREHWALLAFLALLAVELFSLFRAPVSARGVIFATFEIAKQPFAFLLIWYFSRGVFAGYPALGSFASKSASYLLAFCAVLGLGSFLLEPALPQDRGPMLYLFTAVERALVTGQLGYVLALSIFAGWFPVRISPNLNRFLVGWMFVLAANWATHLLANTNPYWAGYGNAVESITLMIASLYWTFTVTPEGARPAEAARPNWDPVRLERLTSQLDQMEAQLSRRG